MFIEGDRVELLADRRIKGTVTVSQHDEGAATMRVLRDGNKKHRITQVKQWQAIQIDEPATTA